MIWTDPPYGVAYQTKLSTEEAVARHRRTDGLEISNDEPDDIPTLLAAAFDNAPLKPGGAYYACRMAPLHDRPYCFSHDSGCSSRPPPPQPTCSRSANWRSGWRTSRRPWPGATRRMTTGSIDAR